MFIEIPVSRIFRDPTFNCRGSIAIHDCLDLAEQIRTHKQLQNVVVRPYRGDGDFDFALIAGFRRLTAIADILKWPTVWAAVMDVTDAEAASANFVENIGRENLNPLQEARTMEELYPQARWSCRDVAQKLSKHTGWVLIRRYLLELPADVQDMIVSGRIPLSRAGALRQAPDVHEAAKALLARKSPRSASPKIGKRNMQVISRMIARLLEAGITGLAPRLLGWANGYVSDDEIDAEIENHLKT